MILPKNWSLVSLGEIAASGRGTFSNGPFGSDLVKADLTDVGIPVIYIRDIRDGYYDRVSASCVTEEKAEQLSACWVKPGDVLIAKVGDPPGTAAVYPEDQPLGIVTQDVIRLRLNSEIADSQYVHNWLNSPLGKYAVKSITVEATRARFPLGDFKNLKLPLPPIAEQRRIAAILDRADAVRRKRQEAIALTEELLRSAFLEMFGDPVANPKGWDSGTILDVVSNAKNDVRCGPFGTQLKVDEIVSEGIPLLGIENVKGGRFRASTSKFLTPNKAKELAAFDVQANDVLVTRMGTIGHACVVPRAFDEARFSYHLFRIRPDIKKCLPGFLASTITWSGTFLAQLEKLAHGAIMAGLKTSDLKEVQFLIPPIQLQEEYLEIVSKTEILLQNQQERGRREEDFFNSLLQRAFRGEL